MWDASKDQDAWERVRDEKINIVFALTDLLIKLKVLGVGWDMDRDSDYNTGTYVDKHWKV